EAGLHDDFVAALAERVRRIRLGAGLAAGTQMGPVISASQRDQVLGMVNGALAEGARLLAGGRSPQGEGFERGFWLEPTLLGNVRGEMRIAREEISGPVITVERFDGEDEALQRANGTPFGLAAGVWTRD